MANENLLNKFEDKELETISIFLGAKAERAAITIDEFIETSLLQGLDINTIRDSLLDDLNNGGRIFGEFRNSVRSTVRGSINRVRDAGQFSETGITEKFRWSAVLVKTCRASPGLAGCIDRHGMVKSWDEWERLGLPRAGNTTCKENCHCVLLPSDITELEPIQRTKK